MKKELTTADFRRMIAAANQTVVARSAEFSQLDAALGDGDHGEAMATAFAVVAKAAVEGIDFKKMLSDMGFAVMLETSGSTSTLLGGFLLGMSDAAPVAQAMDAAQVRALFRSGLEGVQKNTKASVGDKTMMDAVIPAVAAMEATAGDDVCAVLRAGADAALQGAAATKAMKATFGRARNLGDKTIGHLDAGATSWASLFQSFADACCQ